MSRRTARGRRAAVLALAGAGVLLAAGAPAEAAVRAGAPARTALGDVRVTVDTQAVGAAVGGRFTLRTTLTNAGAAPTGPLLAHLDVAGLSPDVYVDPEDWSTRRSRYLGPLPPHGAVTLDWDVQAVQAGSFDTFVVVLPTDARGTAHDLLVSPSVRVTVAGRRTLSAGGVLPVAVCVPAALALLVGAGLRRRRP